jgi:hypothetical protein
MVFAAINALCLAAQTGLGFAHKRYGLRVARSLPHGNGVRAVGYRLSAIGSAMPA